VFFSPKGVPIAATKDAFAATGGQGRQGVVLDGGRLEACHGIATQHFDLRLDSDGRIFLVFVVVDERAVAAVVEQQVVFDVRVLSVKASHAQRTDGSVVVVKADARHKVLYGLTRPTKTASFSGGLVVFVCFLVAAGTATATASSALTLSLRPLLLPLVLPGLSARTGSSRIVLELGKHEFFTRDAGQIVYQLLSLTPVTSTDQGDHGERRRSRRGETVL